MYPWEHLLVGYLSFSIYAHLRYREPPSGGEAVGAAIGSQLPDVIDKPLAWTFSVVETGYSIGHSIFVAPGIVLASIGLARRLDRPRVGIAIVIAYLSHLTTDIVYPVVYGRSIEPRVVLWPVASPPPSGETAGLLERSVHYVLRIERELLAGDATVFVAVQVILGCSVLLLWFSDGCPGMRELLEYIRSNHRHQ